MSNFFRQDFLGSVVMSCEEVIESSVLGGESFNIHYGIYEIEDVYFLKGENRIFNKIGEYFFDITDVDTPIQKNLDSEFERIKSGARCFSNNSSNYFHLLYERLFALFVLENYSFTGDVYLPKNDGHVLHELISSLSNKVVFTYSNIHFDTLYLPFFNIYKKSKFEDELWKKVGYSKNFANFLNEKISNINHEKNKNENKNDTVSFPSKLFISRADAKFRKLINYGEVKTILEDAGYVEVNFSGLNIIEQSKYIRNAKKIIAVHGAANSNFIFMNTNTEIIEIFNEEYRPANFQIITEIRGGLYKALFFSGDELSAPFMRNITVKIEALIKSI